MNEISNYLVPNQIVRFLWTVARGLAWVAVGLAACARQAPPAAVPPPSAVQALSPAPSAPPAAAALSARPEGLWEGVIFFQRGWLELELLVELMQGGEAGWAGNADLPTQGLQYIPLSQLAVEGRKVAFEIHRPAEGSIAAIDARFEGTLSEDSRTISGKFLEEGKTFDFALERIGEAGLERPVPVYPDLRPLSDRGEELQALFNREEDKLRLVLLLSPT